MSMSTPQGEATRREAHEQDQTYNPSLTGIGNQAECQSDEMTIPDAAKQSGTFLTKGKKSRTTDGASNSILRSDEFRDRIMIDGANGFPRNMDSHQEDGGTANHERTASPTRGHDRNCEPQMSEKSEENAIGDKSPKQERVSYTNILFPPLPLYGAPSFKRRVRYWAFQISAFFLSLTFLGLIVLASFITSIPRLIKKITFKLTLRDMQKLRPFYEEERRRADIRSEKEKAWDHRSSAEKIGGDQEATADEYLPTEGGRDKIMCDVGYYARRVGLEVDVFQVRTEDGFLIDLWHVYDPREYTISKRNGTQSITNGPGKTLKSNIHKPKFPVLLMHGLLQSSGAYCSNDDDSLAFWLCKSGFDVWLGNNRCGFSPAHESLLQSDPRMWCWNIRHMGVFDLPALTSQVLAETGFDKLGLICHSQSTAETLIALSKDHRPEFGEKLTVFCGLAPAAYAGPLIGRIYFKFMRNISPFLFQMMFGIHAFIPFMMQMHSLLHPKVYGWLGYKVFSFLFNWSDARWDRGLRNRLFQFAPVYVSAETMRWWLGHDGFAKHKCILSTKEVVKLEEREDGVCIETTIETCTQHTIEATTLEQPGNIPEHGYLHKGSEWYDEQVPPFAMWVCGNDQLVDGQRLLRRFAKGREPHVKLVHSKVIKDYEHLDVLWAIDAVEQVFMEIREVLWKTCNARDRCRVPEGCETVTAWSHDLPIQPDQPA